MTQCNTSPHRQDDFFFLVYCDTETLDLKEGVLLFYHNCVSSKMLYKVYKLLGSTAKFLKSFLTLWHQMKKKLIWLRVKKKNCWNEKINKIKTPRPSGVAVADLLMVLAPEQV